MFVRLKRHADGRAAGTEETDDLCCAEQDAGDEHHIHQTTREIVELAAEDQHAAGDRDGGKPQGKGRRGDRGDKGRGPKGAKGKGPRQDKGAKTYQSRPEKKDRIDPDNPFAAALMGLKDKG